MRPILSLLLVLAAIPAHAELVDINVGEDAFRGNLSGPLSRAFQGAKGQYEVGALFGSENGEDLSAGHLGILLTGDAGAPNANVTAGLGLRGQFIDGEGDSGGGLGLGGQIDVRLPNYNRVGLFAYGYYGPEVTSFGDVDDFHEYAVSLGYEVLRDAMIYVGYRQLEADFGAVEAKEDGAHVGLRLDF